MSIFSARSRVQRLDAGNHRLARLLLLVVVLAVVMVPPALAVTLDYWRQMNLCAGCDGTNSTYHNNTYNQLYWGPGATYPGELFMKTPAGDVHYYHSFFGNAAFSDPGTYFAAPYCGNNDVSAHFINHCTVQW